MKLVTEESTRVGRRMLLGGIVGAVLGLLVGMVYEPPYAGMSAASADVQGLVYAAWLMTSVLGGIIGLLLGVLDICSAIKRKRCER